MTDNTCVRCRRPMLRAGLCCDVCLAVVPTVQPRSGRPDGHGAAATTPSRPTGRTAAANATAAKAPDLFLALCAAAGLPAPIPEHRFHPHRRWRTDYAWPDRKLALEVEGGIWTQGRHTRGAGFLADLEKYNTLTAMGWRLLRVTPQQLLTADTLELVERAIAA